MLAKGNMRFLIENVFFDDNAVSIKERFQPVSIHIIINLAQRRRITERYFL